MATPTLVQKSKNSSVYPSAPMHVTLPAAATAGNCLVIVIEGAKVLDPFSVNAVSSHTADPVVKDNLGNTLTSGLLGKQVDFDGDLGYYSSLYVYYAANVAGGNQTFTLTNLDAAGRPTFNHGINMQVFEFSGVAATPLDGAASAKVSSNAPSAGTLTMTASGNLILSVAHVRRASTLTAPAGFTVLDSGRVMGTPGDYYMVAFYNGTGYSDVATITNVGVATDVLTVQAVNTFVVGSSVTLEGITLTGATDLNGTSVTVASKTGTQFTANVTHADVTAGASAGTATGLGLIPSTYAPPAFSTLRKNSVAVVTAALKHS